MLEAKNTCNEYPKSFQPPTFCASLSERNLLYLKLCAHWEFSRQGREKQEFFTMKQGIFILVYSLHHIARTRLKKAASIFGDIIDLRNTSQFFTKRIINRYSGILFTNYKPPST